MYIVLAFLLAFTWVISVFFLHITGVAIHSLVILAAFTALLQVTRPRRYHAPREALPKDGVK